MIIQSCIKLAPLSQWPGQDNHVREVLDANPRYAVTILHPECKFMNRHWMQNPISRLFLNTSKLRAEQKVENAISQLFFEHIVAERSGREKLLVLHSNKICGTFSHTISNNFDRLQSIHGQTFHSLIMTSVVGRIILSRENAKSNGQTQKT